jgi:hypothetical protein
MELLKVPEVARQLRISTRSAYKLPLPWLRVGKAALRVRRCDLERWLDKQLKDAEAA